MKVLWVLLAVLMAATSVSAMSKKHHKKPTSEVEKKHLEDIEKKLEDVKALEEELEREIEGIGEESSDEENGNPEEGEEEEEVREGDYQEDEAEYDFLPEEVPDPCREMYCGAGRVCVVMDNGNGECACINACEMENDPRRRVCSNLNETWMSDCELYRQRCLCEENDQSCLKPENKHAHIEYYGECQQMPECDKEELEDFPRRMSEWLFHIMRDMADREILSEHYIRLEREAEEDPNKQWSYAVVWKWCELDTHPKDKIVSRHELFPIRAPLYTLENCVATFLDSCDTNNDHSITLREWAACTKLTEEDLEKFESFCEDIREE